MLAQVGNQGNVKNQTGNVVNENVQENIGNVIVNGNRVDCSYKEFFACNPKEYDGKEGVVVLTRWIEKMKSVHDMSGCSIDQKVKYTAGSFVGNALTWWDSQIRMLSREVAVSMSCNDFKFMMIQEFCPSHEMQKLDSELWNHATIFKALTDEAVRNGSIKKVEKKGNVGEPSKDKNGKDDNKRTRTENAFATTVNPVGGENTDDNKRTKTENAFATTVNPVGGENTGQGVLVHDVTCTNNLAAALHFFWQWQQSSLAVGTYTASGNSNLAVGMPYAFYSQQSLPKLDAPDEFKFSRIK
nr:reverse transcriptase domain-containing protein [Tanacetum cinerariifolium]